MRARKTGNVIERQTRRGTVYGLRFTAGGQRRPVTLPDGSTGEDAERRPRLALAEVGNGTWTRPKPAPIIDMDVHQDPDIPPIRQRLVRAEQARMAGHRPPRRTTYGS